MNGPHGLSEEVEAILTEWKRERQLDLKEKALMAFMIEEGLVPAENMWDASVEALVTEQPRARRR